MPDHASHVVISIAEGRIVRDLLYNGLLDHLREAGLSVTLLAEAATVPAFVREWQCDGVDLAPLPSTVPTRKRGYALTLRQKVMRRKQDRLLKTLLRLERHYLYPPRQDYVQLFQQRRPALVVATQVHSLKEAELIATARHLGIPTLGVVTSWDNVYKGLQNRPDYLTVWNTINRDEVLEFARYAQDAVTIIGAPQFDPYFDPSLAWSRAQLAAHFNLDPARPILLYASLGYFIPGFDETYWMDALLDLIDQGAIQGRPQVICRLHPWSRWEHFHRYADHPDVRLSYVDRYWPGLTWYMTREDVGCVGNILRHSDVVITPGSTISLEAAIFDRPTLVPIFHAYQPEQARRYFKTVVMGKHFGRIERLDLVPILREPQDYASAINHCLQDPAWYREQRAQLVSDYVHFTDGHSTRRLADLIGQLCGA